LRSSVSDDDVFNFIVAITEDTFPSARHGLSLDEVVRKIAWWIKNNSETLRDDTGTMKTSDFLNRCAQAGMIVKESGHKFVIVNPLAARSGKYRSICLNSSTRQLNGKTIMSFLRTLGLNAPNSGIDCNEFYDGAKVERAAIHRFIAALRRLAKT
jgi:death-on-curing protein